VTDVLECLSGVLSSLLDKDFISTWVLNIGTKEGREMGVSQLSF